MCIEIVGQFCCIRLELASAQDAGSQCQLVVIVDVTIAANTVNQGEWLSGVFLE